MIDHKTRSLDYIDCIQRSLDYIEDNLKSDVSLSGCARAAGFSTYHYYRVFGAYIGLPVMEYVRKRKLAHVLKELVGERRIIDIAMDFGFGSERALRRAFKKEYGATPGRYRKSFATTAIPVKPVLAALRQDHIEGGIVIEPKIVCKPAFKVAGFELKTTSRNRENYSTVPEFWDKYLGQKWRNKLLENIHPAGEAELGLCLQGNIMTENFSYVIGIEVTGFKGLPEGFFRGEVPAATWAVFTTPPAEREGAQFTRAIQGTWDYIFHTWFPKSGCEFDGSVRIDFEYCDERAAGDHGIRIDIYVPVVKRR